MALGNQSNTIYLSIADGKVVRRVAEGTPGAESRTKKDGNIVWEQRHSYVTGYLKSISISEKTYAGTDMKDWVFELEDQGEAYTLQVMYDSRYATSLLYALCNPVVDFSKPITISPWMKIISDKKKTACYLKQGAGKDNNIEWYFTKDNLHGLPELVETKFKGKAVWDSYDRMQFLEKFVNDNVKPKLATNYTPPIDNEPEFVGDNAPDEDESSDLPF